MLLARSDDLAGVSCKIHTFAAISTAMLRAALFFSLLATAGVASLFHLSGPSSAGLVPQVPRDTSSLAVKVSLRPKARRVVVVPKARWSNKGAQRSWTLAMLASLRGPASKLTDIVPRDIDTWCPSYRTASRQEREAFWVGLVSSLAWHESTHRPSAVGGGGLWYGLTQILPSTARLYKCKARSGAALKDPEDNLSCALRIMASTVPRDGVISAGMRGVAADWGPFHSSRKREDMRAWVSSQSYCTGLSRSLRPIARPASLGLADLPEPPSIAPPETATRPTPEAGDTAPMTAARP